MSGDDAGGADGTVSGRVDRASQGLIPTNLAAGAPYPLDNLPPSLFHGLRSCPIRPRLISQRGDHMRSITAAGAKNNFGELIDLARAAPVRVTKYDRPVVVVMSAEEFERRG